MPTDNDLAARLRAALRQRAAGAEVPDALYRALAELPQPSRRSSFGLRMMAIGATLAAATILAGLVLGQWGLPPTVAGPSSRPVPSSAVPPTSTSAPSSAAVSWPLGATRDLNCGDAGVSFNAAASVVACGSQLLSWPDMQPIANLAGIPDAWGGPNGNYLLIGVSTSQFSVVDSQGNTTSIPAAGGNTSARWSGDDVLLVSRTDNALEIRAWGPGQQGLREVAALPATRFTNAQRSADGRWLVLWSAQCAGGVSGCQYELAEVAADHPQRELNKASGTGTLNEPQFLSDDSYWYQAQDAQGMSVWKGAPSGLRLLADRLAHVYPLERDAVAVQAAPSAGAGVARLSLLDGSRTTINLRAIGSGAMRGISPDGQWLLAVTGPQSLAVVRSDGRVRYPLQVGTDATNASAAWSPDGRFVVVFAGPPPQQTALRIADSAVSNAPAPEPAPPIVAFDASDATHAWAVTERALLATVDGGRSWRIVPGANVAGVRALLAVGRQQITVAGIDGLDVMLRASIDGGRTWQQTRLRPGGQPSDVGLAAGDGMVAVLVQQATSSNFSVADLLVSRAGGAFAERRAPAAGRLSITGAGELWLAGGVAGNQLWRSADAGLSWTEIRLPPTLGTTIGVSAPLRIADRLILPVTINGPATREAWLTSNDSGATWQQLALISVGGDTGPGVALPASAAGDRVLVAGSLGRLFAVTAGGQSPAPVSPNGLPQVVTRLQFSSSSAGWALTTTAGCVSGKSQCFSVTRVFTTRDGGQTWNQTKLPG